MPYAGELVHDLVLHAFLVLHQNLHPVPLPPCFHLPVGAARRPSHTRNRHRHQHLQRHRDILGLRAAAGVLGLQSAEHVLPSAVHLVVQHGPAHGDRLPHLPPAHARGVETQAAGEAEVRLVRHLRPWILVSSVHPPPLGCGERNLPVSASIAPETNTLPPLFL